MLSTIICATNSTQNERQSPWVLPNEIYKLFHKDTADGTKDEQNALVRAKGWWSKGAGTTELCLINPTVLHFWNPWTFHKLNRNLYGGFNVRHYKLIHVLFLLKTLQLNTVFGMWCIWPWGSRKCNERHRSNIILLYTQLQVQLPFLSAVTWKIQIG